MGGHAVVRQPAISAALRRAWSYLDVHRPLHDNLPPLEVHAVQLAARDVVAVLVLVIDRSTTSTRA